MPIERICKQCGVVFYIKPFLLKRGGNRGTFCSNECRYKWMSDNFKGDNNPNYDNRWDYRKRQEFSQSRKGSNNPFFNHKLYNEVDIKGKPYCFKFYGNDGIRKRSLAFFGYTCVECGKTQKESLIDNKQSLSVHHVYYRKKSCCEESEKFEHGIKRIGNKLFIKDLHSDVIEHDIIGDVNKFVVLCSSCHGKTSRGNRYKWILHYESKINNEYDGKSFLTKDEYKEYLKK